MKIKKMTEETLEWPIVHKRPEPRSKSRCARVSCSRIKQLGVEEIRVHQRFNTVRRESEKKTNKALAVKLGP